MGEDEFDFCDITNSITVKYVFYSKFIYFDLDSEITNYNYYKKPPVRPLHASLHDYFDYQIADISKCQ